MTLADLHIYQLVKYTFAGKPGAIKALESNKRVAAIIDFVENDAAEYFGNEAWHQGEF